MPTLQMFPGQTIKLTAKDELCDGTYRSSATTPTWTLSDHTIAEFSQMLQSAHEIQLTAFGLGTVTVTATLDSGPVTFTINIIAQPTLTATPVGSYVINPGYEVPGMVQDSVVPSVPGPNFTVC